MLIDQLKKRYSELLNPVQQGLSQIGKGVIQNAIPGMRAVSQVARQAQRVPQVQQMQNRVMNTRIIPGQQNTFNQVRQNVIQDPAKYILSSSLAQGRLNTGIKPIDTNIVRPTGHAANALIQSSSAGLVQPPSAPTQTWQDKVGAGVGFGAGMLNPYNVGSKVLNPVGLKVAGAIGGKLATRQLPQLVKSGIGAVGSEAAQTAALTAGNMLQGNKFDPASALAQGLGIRGIGGAYGKAIGKGIAKHRTRMAEGDIQSVKDTIFRMLDKKTDLNYAVNNKKADEQFLRQMAADYLDKGFAQKAKLDDVAQELMNRIRVDQGAKDITLPSMGIKGNDDFIPQARPGSRSNVRREDPRIAEKFRTAEGSLESTQNTGIAGGLPQGQRLRIRPETPLNASSTLPDGVGQGMGQPNTTEKQPLRMSTQTSKLQSQGSNSYDEIIAEGKKEIGRLKDEKGKTLRELGDDFYTQWIDRYNPITKVVKQVEDFGKKEGFELRPESNPRFTLRRFSGMGGIAEQRYNKELKPVLDEMTAANIDKGDMDLYLKARRDINLSSRGIYGSDANQARQRIQALETKYGGQLDQHAQKLYAYQSQGFKELADSGFFSPEVAKSIQNTNADYVPFQRVMDELDEYLGIPTKKLQQSANPITAIKGSDKQIYSPIESIISNTFKQRAAIEKNNVAKSIVGLQKAMPDIGFEKVAKSGDDTITVWQNGKKEFYNVGRDIADTVKGMNEEQMNTFLKVLTVPASILRQGATGRNPEFMLPNMIRDQFDAAVNAKYGYVPVVDYLRGLSHLIREDLGGGDKLYREWVNSGGSQSFGDLSGRKSIQTMMDTANSKKKLFTWLGDTLDVMGRYSETPTRLGLYSRAKQATGNSMIAAYESREGTMDFSRMGSKMKVANSLIPFLNVGIQGSNKIIRSIKDDPAKFALKAGFYGITPSLMTTLYNVTEHPEEYKEIPQYVKDTNFVVVTGRENDGTVGYITIPKGNVVNYLANPVENFISYLANTNQESVSDMAMQFFSSALPVIGDGKSLKEIGIKTIGQNLPQAIKPITENLINKSFFKYDPNKEQSKEIVPYYLNDKPPAERAYQFTPVMYKKIGALLNISPLQVQNAMEGYLAGGAKIPAQVIDTLSAVGDNREVDRNKIPVLRRFIQHTYPSSSTSKAQNNERVGLFGKADASESITLEEIKYVDEAGRNKTVNLTPPIKGNGIDAFTNQNWMYSKARELYTAPISPEQREQAYKQLGVTGEQVGYDYKATKTNDIKSQYVLSKAQSMSHEDLLREMAKGRQPSISGAIFASDGVITSLAEAGFITAGEAKLLKKLDYNTKTGQLKSSGGGAKKGKKPTFVKLSVPKARKVKSLTPKTVSRVKQYKLVAPKFKNSRIKKVKRLS